MRSPNVDGSRRGAPPWLALLGFVVILGGLLCALFAVARFYGLR